MTFGDGGEKITFLKGNCFNTKPVSEEFRAGFFQIEIKTLINPSNNKGGEKKEAKKYFISSIENV